MVRGIRPFIDTWNNIHVFQLFDYEVSDPASVARNYDAVWGAQLNHVKEYRSVNPAIFLAYYIPFHRDWGAFPGFWSRHALACMYTVSGRNATPGTQAIHSGARMS